MDNFRYSPSMKTVEEAPEVTAGKTHNKALVAFIQVEAEDEEDLPGKEKKLVKLLKWAAKKNDTTHVVLHSFAHLSESKAPAASTLQLFNQAETRMLHAGYTCEQTPFGYFLDIAIEAPGKPSARIFKSL